MKRISVLLAILFCFTSAYAQSDSQKIYDTEKAFEKTLAEKGINQAFIDFSAPDGTCFPANLPVNCREYWKSAPPSPAFLSWNPVFVDVSSNGALAYTTGNSVYKAKGKDDPTAYYGEYATIWQRQPNGNYQAVVDIGISHDKSASIETKWASPTDSGKELNEKKISAADASTTFFETARDAGLGKAYKMFLADDARVYREGKMPMLGKQAALEFYKKDKSKIAFARRSIFSSAADLSYTSNSYTITDKDGKEITKGNFLQVWKLRNGRWQIVLDFFNQA